MNDDVYWTLFQRIWESNDTATPYDRLNKYLEELPIKELLLFSRLFDSHRAALLRPGHLAAAFLLYEGTLDDEDFLEYLEAVVAAPRAVYVDVKENPDRILDYPMYSSLLELDGYPFASVADWSGVIRFGEIWQMELRRQERESIKIECVQLGSRRGLEILTPSVCEGLVPRLFQIYGTNCNWG